MSEETIQTNPMESYLAASDPALEPGPACAPPVIPAWLTTGLQRIGEHATVVAHCAYTINALAIDQPSLILPLAGIKRVGLGGERGQIEPGAFLMIHQATSLQIENVPPSHGGKPYRAWAIGFPWRIVELARTLLSVHAHPVADVRHTSAFTHGAIEPLLPALRQLMDVLDSAAVAAATKGTVADAALVDHALLGVLIALARNDHGHFLRESDPSLSARIRLLVSSAPEHDWTSADFEQALHMSGATLRRRLAEANTSLRDLLLEARLHHGLVLLQTSRKPLKSVAQACGYRSVPSFTRNFIARFGIEPSAVAGR